MARIATTEGQDIYDYSIQNYGQIDNIFDIFALNTDVGLGINDNLGAGNELVVEVEGKGNVNNKEFMERAGFKPVNVDIIDIFTNEGDYSDDYNNDYS